MKNFQYEEVREYINFIRKIPMIRQKEIDFLHKNIRQFTTTIDDFVYSHTKEDQFTKGLIRNTNQTKPFYEEIIKDLKNEKIWTEEQLTLYRNSKNRILMGSLRLVVYWAKRYNFLNMDAIQEGNLGLQRAIELYNPKISKFTTYSHGWIKQKFMRMPKKSQIEIPDWLQKHKSYVLKLEDKLRKSGHSYCFDDLIPELRKKLTENQLQQLSVSFIQTKQLDQVCKDGKIRSRDPGQLDEEREEPNEREIIKRIMQKTMKNTLSERERMIINLKFTQNEKGNYPSNGEIAIQMGITRQRIEQIMKSSFNLLRNQETLRELI